MLRWLDATGAFARRWARGGAPWTNVYGLARTLLALSTALTLAFNRTPTLFSMLANGVRAPVCVDLRAAGLFCVVPEGSVRLTQWIAVLALLLVASGYRPRYTGILHWWIACSFQANALTLDGGDSAAAVLALILIPVTLTDRRVWHWQACPAPTETFLDDVARIAALLALLAARIQVAGIYFHAAMGKFQVEEWTNGTAMYYWVANGYFGASGVVAALLRPLVMNGVALTLLTWSVLVLEYFLSAAIILPKRHWKVFLWLGIALHAAIIVVHGLISFGMVMFAALILYLRPIEEPFAFDSLWERARLFASGLGASAPSVRVAGR